MPEQPGLCPQRVIGETLTLINSYVDWDAIDDEAQMKFDYNIQELKTLIARLPVKV